MANGKSSFLPTAQEAEEDRRRERFKKLVADDKFKQQVTLVRQYIAKGHHLSECRDYYNIDDRNRWGDIVFYLASYYYKTENLVLEWQLKQQDRYQKASKAYEYAELVKDHDAMLRAIAVLAKLDEADISMKSQLGIIKPIKDADDLGGEGVSNTELAAVEEKFNEALKQRILAKLQLQREAQQPVTIDVLVRSQDAGNTDKLEQAPLDENNPGRSVPADEDTKRIANGGVDLLHPMGSPFNENKKDS